MWLRHFVSTVGVEKNDVIIKAKNNILNQRKLNQNWRRNGELSRFVTKQHLTQTNGEN